MRETPADKTKPLLSRAVRPGGLFPEWEGALMTGDRNLLHVALSCIYRISDPQAYKGGIADSPGSRTQLTQAIRSAVCYAAIQAAATRTVDGIKTDKESFLADVKTRAQQHLSAMLGDENAIVPGVTITKMLMGNKTEPLRALKTYAAADRARMASEKLQSTAKAEAKSILNAAAGPGYRALVGDPLLIGVQEPPREQARDEAHSHTEDYDLIGQYDDARQAGNADKAEELLKHIGEVLASNLVSGQASRILSQARADKTDIIESAKSRYRRFAELLPEFEKNPEFLMERHWAAAREEILESPLVEKIYLETSLTSKTTIRINRPPEHTRAIKRELLKLKKEREAEKAATATPPPPGGRGGR
jgi:cell division septum initiation protein DivIVA